MELMTEDIQYIFTKDKGLLDEFFKIREIVYADIKGLNASCGKKNVFDESADTMLVTSNNKVIGGGRINFSDKGDNSLPMENPKDSFYLKNIFPDFNLNIVKCCEVSRVIILPEFRNKEILKKIHKEVIKKAKKYDCKYLFCLSDKTRCRRHRITSRSLGYNMELYDGLVPMREVYKELHPLTIGVIKLY